ncbi:MAG: ABC transporter transmembrane domain-containing protein [Cohaesibacter sp.]|jgi:ATP-binding cassette subfamily C protein LapB|nr:ABC transporter transmembrane domain-containing protein [Cohaesibacter sp.]
MQEQLQNDVRQEQAGSRQGAWSRLRMIFEPPASMRTLWFSDMIRVPKKIIAASFVINVLGLGMPIVILQIYDRIIPNLSYDTLLYMMVGLCVVMVIDTVLKVIRSHISGWSASYIDYVSSIEAIKRTLQATPDRVEKDPASTHIDRMNALSATARMFAGPARMGLIDLPFIFIFLGVMAVVSPLIAALVVGLFALFAWRLLSRTREIQALQEERQILDRRKYDFAIEVLSGLETVKTMACEPQMIRRYERLQETIAVAFHRSVRLDGITQSMSAAFASVTMVTIVSSGAFLVVQGSQSIGSLACCLLLGGRAVEVLVRSVRSWSEMSNFDLVKQNVDQLFSINDEAEEETRYIALENGAIELDQVTMTSRGKSEQTYHMSLTIPHGRSVGLKGCDANDDHHFLKLLRGKALPEAGAIKIGGMDCAELMGADLTESIAYVPNSPAIFRGTILENLTLFNIRDDLHAAREAAQLIGLESDIQQLPHGYDMMVGSGGYESLPPGFQQRICIARAIAKRPKILVLEEANALLDQRADTLLRQGLESLKGSMTIIFLSNRPSFLSMADELHTLKNGGLQDYVPPNQAPQKVQQNEVQLQAGQSLGGVA